MKKLRLLGDKFLRGDLTLKSTIISTYNNLHDLLDRLCRQAAKGIRKKLTGGDLWSPKLRDFIQTVDYWSRNVKRRLGVKTSWHQIVQIGKELNLEYKHSTSLQTAQNNLQKARLARRKAKEDAPESFKQHRNTLAKAKAKDQGLSLIHI